MRRPRATLGLAPPEPREKRRSYLTMEEWKRAWKVLEQCPLRDQALIRIIYEGGLRAAEPGVMKVSYLKRINEGRVYVWRGKGSKDGYVSVTKKTAAILKKWVRKLGSEAKKDPSRGALHPDSPLFPGYKGAGIHPITARRVWQHVAREARLPQELHHTHVLKHSRCQHLLEHAERAGEHPSMMHGVIAEIVGHARARTTIEHYIKTSGAATKKALAWTAEQEED